MLLQLIQSLGGDTEKVVRRHIRRTLRARTTMFERDNIAFALEQLQRDGILSSDAVPHPDGTPGSPYLALFL